ncbi:MAG TPA: hypothetical protein VII66_02245, partial [Gemmatimonadaceae bacterium]
MKHGMLKRALPRSAPIAIAIALGLAFAACADRDDKEASPRIVIRGADVQHGKQLVTLYNCGACHAIAGVPHASGRVGPPLNGFAGRV